MAFSPVIPALSCRDKTQRKFRAVKPTSPTASPHDSEPGRLHSNVHANQHTSRSTSPLFRHASPPPQQPVLPVQWKFLPHHNPRKPAFGSPSTCSSASLSSIASSSCGGGGTTGDKTTSRLFGYLANENLGLPSSDEQAISEKKTPALYHLTGEAQRQELMDRIMAEMEALIADNSSRKASNSSSSSTSDSRKLPHAGSSSSSSSPRATKRTQEATDNTNDQDKDNNNHHAIRFALQKSMETKANELAKANGNRSPKTRASRGHLRAFDDEDDDEDDEAAIEAAKAQILREMNGITLEEEEKERAKQQQQAQVNEASDRKEEEAGASESSSDEEEEVEDGDDADEEDDDDEEDDEYDDHAIGNNLLKKTKSHRHHTSSSKSLKHGLSKKKSVGNGMVAPLIARSKELAPGARILWQKSSRVKLALDIPKELALPVMLLQEEVSANGTMRHLFHSSGASFRRMSALSQSSSRSPSQKLLSLGDQKAITMTTKASFSSLTGAQPSTPSSAATAGPPPFQMKLNNPTPVVSTSPKRKTRYGVWYLRESTWWERHLQHRQDHEQEAATVNTLYQFYYKPETPKKPSTPMDSLAARVALVKNEIPKSYIGKEYRDYILTKGGIIPPYLKNLRDQPPSQDMPSSPTSSPTVLMASASIDIKQ